MDLAHFTNDAKFLNCEYDSVMKTTTKDASNTAQSTNETYLNWHSDCGFKVVGQARK